MDTIHKQRGLALATTGLALAVAVIALLAAVRFIEVSVREWMVTALTCCAGAWPRTPSAAGPGPSP